LRGRGKRQEKVKYLSLGKKRGGVPVCSSARPFATNGKGKGLGSGEKEERKKVGKKGRPWLEAKVWRQRGEKGEVGCGKEGVLQKNRGHAELQTDGGGREDCQKKKKKKKKRERGKGTTKWWEKKKFQNWRQLKKQGTEDTKWRPKSQQTFA